METGKGSNDNAGYLGKDVETSLLQALAVLEIVIKMIKIRLVQKRENSSSIKNDKEKRRIEYSMQKHIHSFLDSYLFHPHQHEDDNNSSGKTKID